MSLQLDFERAENSKLKKSAENMLPLNINNIKILKNT